MANSIELVKAYLRESDNFDQIFKEASLTNELELASQDVKFVGAKEIKYKNFSVGDGSVAEYSRENGHQSVDAVLSWKSAELQWDWGAKLRIDAMDIEEGGTDMPAYVNAYIRETTVPNADKNRLHVLAANAGTTVYAAEALTAQTIEAALDAGISSLKNEEVLLAGVVIYMKESNYALLIDSNKTTHSLTVDQFNGEVKKDIYKYRGCIVKSVPAARFPVDYNFIIVQPLSQWCCVKHNPISYFPAGSIPGFDGEEADYRIYHGCGVRANRKKGIYANALPKAASKLTALSFANSITLSPTFDDDVTEYTATLGDSVTATGAITTTVSSGATLVIKKGKTVVTAASGVAVESGDVLTFTVTNDSATTSPSETVYTVTVA